MAAKKKPAGPDTGVEQKSVRRARSTERVNIWLPPLQVAWLKSKRNISETVRALITEAMNLENLARSVKVGKKR